MIEFCLKTRNCIAMQWEATHILGEILDMRHLTEKPWECGEDMVIAVAYFEKVYDSMKREMYGQAYKVR